MAFRLCFWILCSTGQSLVLVFCHTEPSVKQILSTWPFINTSNALLHLDNPPPPTWWALCQDILPIYHRATSKGVDAQIWFSNFMFSFACFRISRHLLFCVSPCKSPEHNFFSMLAILVFVHRIGWRVAHFKRILPIYHRATSKGVDAQIWFSNFMFSFARFHISRCLLFCVSPCKSPEHNFFSMLAILVFVHRIGWRVAHFNRLKRI